MALTRLITTNAQGSNCSVSGFTLVEVLIAGLLLAAAMTAIARLSTTALTNSSQQAKRNRIEAAIKDNIQLIHQADSNLTFGQKSLTTSTQQQAACQAPAVHLKTELENQAGLSFVEPPLLTNSAGKKAINRSIQASTKTGITSIIYEFEAPEKTIGLEQRVIDMNPNFQSFCLGLSPEQQIKQNTADQQPPQKPQPPQPGPIIRQSVAASASSLASPPKPVKAPGPAQIKAPKRTSPKPQAKPRKNKQKCRKIRRTPWMCICSQGRKITKKRCP